MNQRWIWLLAAIALIAFAGATFPFFWGWATYGTWQDNPRATIGDLRIILHRWNGHEEFVFINANSTRTLNYDAIGTTCWLVFFAITLPFVTWTIWNIVRKMHKRKRDRGKCAICGYDLTGNIGGICPECGMATKLVCSTTRCVKCGRDFSKDMGGRCQACGAPKSLNTAAP